MMLMSTEARDGSVVTEQDLRQIAFKPTPADWNGVDFEVFRKRVLSLLNQLLEKHLITELKVLHQVMPKINIKIVKICLQVYLLNLLVDLLVR